MKTTSRVSNEKLRRARELRGWSQEELARQISDLAASKNHLGVTLDISTISRWERGINQPSPFYRQILCLLFDKNAEELGLLSSNEPSPSTISPPPAQLEPQQIEEEQIQELSPQLAEHNNEAQNIPEILAESTPSDILPITPHPDISDPINDYDDEEEVIIPISDPPPVSSRIPRRLFIALLAGSGLAVGALSARALFFQTSQPSILIHTTRKTRHWPEIQADIHKRLPVVRVIQWMLKAHGLSLQVDGIFWTETETAVRLFQESATLPITGTVSEATWEKLIMPAELQDQGSQVRALQEQLNIFESRKTRVKVDGDFGTQTEQSIKQFQKAKGLNISGKADLDTWCLLVNGSIN